MLEGKHDSRMVNSMIILYVCVGAIFNAYILAVVAIALFNGYDKRFNGMAWLGENHRNFVHRTFKRLIHSLEIAVELFHQLLGFNEDRRVDVAEDCEDQCPSIE